VSRLPRPETLRVLGAIEAWGAAWADGRSGDPTDEVDTVDLLGRLIAQQAVLAAIVRDDLVDRGSTADGGGGEPA
jgi:hypothetical protein